MIKTATPATPGRTIGRRIAEARKAAHLTQKALSERLEITRAAVGQWEVDMTSPSITMTAKVAKVLKVSPEWLAYGRIAPDYAVANVGPAQRHDHPPGAAAL